MQQRDNGLAQLQQEVGQVADQAVPPAEFCSHGQPAAGPKQILPW